MTIGGFIAPLLLPGGGGTIPLMDSWVSGMLEEAARRQNLPLEGDWLDPAWLEGKPRIGAVLDRISGATPRHLAHDVSEAGVVLGPYLFFPAEGYLAQGERQTRLTEKERDILLTLLAAQGGVVRRSVLLDRVWGYASGVETHTLETHIYRLRQKIETDPARPQILLTAEDGYALNGAS
jgi:DNA-binding response OmpR family regulator